MLRSARDFFTLTVIAWDGPLGQIDDFYFDDLEWTIRYLVVQTDEWLAGRRVLLSPRAVKDVNREEQELRLDLSREQVAGSPPITSAEPISRRYEEELHEYYNWPLYWTTLNPLGLAGPDLVRPLPPAILPEQHEEEEETDIPADNPHLRSLAEVTGYEVRARDGDAGHVEDVIINSANWAIFYLLIDTGSWLQAGKQVLLAPTWVKEIEWAAKWLTVDLSQELIKKSPDFDPAGLVERDYEERLYDHYDRRGYWLGDIPQDVS